MTSTVLTLTLQALPSLTALGLAVAVSACASVAPSESLPAPPSDLAAATRSAPPIVEHVQVNVLESQPPQILLAIEGYVPDGCEVPVAIRQERTGATVRVTLARELPAETVCPAIARPYQHQLLLEGSFPTGTYRFEVNGVVVEQRIN